LLSFALEYLNSNINAFLSCLNIYDEYCKNIAFYANEDENTIIEIVKKYWTPKPFIKPHCDAKALNEEAAEILEEEKKEIRKEEEK